MEKGEAYTFFYRTRSPFSQWHPCKFRDPSLDKEFNCAEQFMMLYKALKFGDTEIAKEIMKATEPREQKALGRKVKGFVEWQWNNVCQDVVYKGNYLKFTQNKHLMEALMKTKGTVLAEASPSDKLWGIGLDEKTAKKTPPERWPGKNWLGLTLTKLRDDLIAKIQS